MTKWPWHVSSEQSINRKNDSNSSHNSYAGGYGVTLSQGNGSNTIGANGGKVTNVHVNSESVSAFILVVTFGHNGNTTSLVITLDSYGSITINKDTENAHCVYMNGNSLAQGIISKNSDGQYDVTSFMSGTPFSMV